MNVVTSKDLHLHCFSNKWKSWILFLKLFCYSTIKSGILLALIYSEMCVLLCSKYLPKDLKTNSRLPASSYIKEKKILLHFLLWFGYFRNKQRISGMKWAILCLFVNISEMFPNICHSKSIEPSGDTEDHTDCHREAADPVSPTVSFHWDPPPLKTTANIKTCSCSGFCWLHQIMLLYHSWFWFLNVLYNWSKINILLENYYLDHCAQNNLFILSYKQFQIRT